MDYFYDEWMKRSKYWFCKNDENDKYLSATFGHLIDSYLFEKDPIIGILIYDQLTRHYYRNEYANHIITYFNKKALDIALIYKNDEKFINNLVYNDWIFYMLVFRHTNIREYLFFVMKEAWKRLPTTPELKQFIKATYNRANYTEQLDIYYNDDNKNNYDKTILDNNPQNDFIYNNNKIGDFSLLPLKEEQLIIVSLSGGVDSISCLFILSQLSRNLVAVHINYNNREETNEEIMFLKSICKKLKIRLYVRTITEITRKPCIENDLRDIYESYTKKVRYNSYKKANKLENNNEIPIVVLGHNKDDCFENILTNISYKNKYDNLKGVELLTTIEGIQFYRPLLNNSKAEIYNYAKTHNLPYLKNSTPDWCQRGKIRLLVVPALEKWDNRIIDGLFNVSHILKDLHLNLNTSIQEFKETDTKPLHQFNVSFLYWKYCIFKLFNFYPSNKSLMALIERLTIWKNKYNSLELNKKTKIIIKKNLILLLWKSKNETYSYNFELLS
jgi:tRNA(Ile)-lysidine synthetase-like protein